MTGPRPRPAERVSALPLARLLGHAADAVAEVRAGRSLNEALARCPVEARPGTQALAFHALRHLGSAQIVRRLLAKKAPAPEVEALLLVALSLLAEPAEAGYAEHTLVDQAVAATRQRTPHAGAFVNAVLRRFLRERDALMAVAVREPLARYEHPEWWLQRLRIDWPGEWERIVAADNQRPPMTLRVNVRRGTAEEYRLRLVDEGIEAAVTSAGAIVLERPLPVTRLPGFAEGDVSVQDAAAQLAAPLLLGGGLPRGAHVLDACAAPGGKTAHLLELADLDLLAIDRDPARLVRVDQTLARLGLRARTRAADAADPVPWWDGRLFDAILLDAPCSASGIVRRHPDIRWLRRPGDIDALARTQAALLDALWPLLRPGGRLLYCTCSIFRAEGQAQIDAFLQRQAGAALAATPPSPGQLLPLSDNPGSAPAADGFFLTLLEKHTALSS